MSATTDARAGRRGAEHEPSPLYMSAADGGRLLAILRPGIADPTQVPCTVVQCIAAHSEEGTSAVAHDFAAIAARAPRLRVLLLDCVPPGRAQAEALRARHAGGAPESQLLPNAAGRAAVLRFGNLYVTEMQGPWPGAGELWHSTIETLRASFDLIVVDSPPLAESFDGVMLAPRMNANLIVVRAESTRAAVAQNLRDQLMEVGAPIAGVILNRRKFHIPGFIYKNL